MTRYGYFLSSEEHEPQELVRQAKLAEEAGFDALWISDHFHFYAGQVLPRLREG
jgi:alkanesulfonate monooxygenase SsuD/methylene tetrahydromethanopterin reductase-like flavin-dependent oxidoreductase (luciferase family)